MNGRTLSLKLQRAAIKKKSRQFLSPLQKRAQLPIFRPMFIVAKRSPISSTAEHLF